MLIHFNMLFLSITYNGGFSVVNTNRFRLVNISHIMNHDDAQVLMINLPPYTSIAPSPHTRYGYYYVSKKRRNYGPIGIFQTKRFGLCFGW